MIDKMTDSEVYLKDLLDKLEHSIDDFHYTDGGKSYYLLEKIHTYGHGLTDFQNPIYNAETNYSDFAYFINGFLQRFKYRFDYFTWNDYTEINNFDTLPYLHRILAIFNEHGVFNKLVFRDGRLNATSNKVNLEPTPFFLGVSSIGSCIIKSRKFKKKFIFLSRVPKPHREDIWYFLKHKNILKDSLWSYQTNDKIKNPFFKSIEGGVIHDDTRGITMLDDQHQAKPYQKDAFCSIVCETYFNINQPIRRGEIVTHPMFITEKTDKCFSTGTPFVMVSTPHFLKHLKELGFKTFDKWWDESYDEEENDNKRMESIYKVIDTINQWPIEYCEKVYEEMIPILTHNQKIQKRYFNKNKKYINQYNVSL